MFTLDQIQGFIAVAEEGNFAHAAERLMITQPPLSRQIQKLERSLGVALLHRTARGSSLTQAGRAFLPEARRLIDQAESAALAARRTAAGAQGTVRVGVTLVGAVTMLGRWVRRAQEAAPDVDLVISEMVSGAQVQALLAGHLDIGLLRGTGHPEVLQTMTVQTEHLLAAVPRGHELADSDATSLASLVEHPLITYDPRQARYFYELLVGAFTRAGLAPHYVQSVRQVTTILALVGAGVGVSIVPESVTSLSPGTVRYLPITDLPDPEVHLVAAWRRENDNPALAALLRLLHSN